MNCVIYRLTNHWLMMGALLLCIFSFLFITTPPSVRGEKEWYPVEVDVWNPPFNDQRQREQKRYTPLDKVQKMRRIRVFIPHLKDAYWMGVNQGLIAARAAVSFWDMGYQAGSYLQRLRGKNGKPMKLAWFPGPEGAGWVAAGDAGLRKATEGSAIEILDTRYGDTGSAAQAKLIEAVLSRHVDDLDCIAGTAISAEAAVKILRKRGLADRVKIVSYYYSPGVHRGIRRGDIMAAPSDLTVLQARIALDVMARILEKRAYYKHVAPSVQVVDSSNVRTWDSSTTLAPRGFRPIFSINDQNLGW